MHVYPKNLEVRTWESSIRHVQHNTLHVQNKDYVDKMKNLDCYQIKIFINLEIVEEEKLYIYIYIYIFKSKNRITWII